MNENYKILGMTLGVAATNAYFFYKETYDAGDGKRHGIFFDPPDRGKFIYDTLKVRDCVVDAILLTHGHFDHIGGANELRECSGAKIYCHEAEKELCGDARLNASMDFGYSTTVTPDVCFKDDEIFSCAGMSCKVLFTPGHTVGGCSYYFEDAGCVFSGDTLFYQSVGRTDLPTGSMSTLVRSIKEKLFVLPDDTAVFPGHMNDTTIAYEKQYNPFL